MLTALTLRAADLCLKYGKLVLIQNLELVDISDKHLV